MLIIVVDLANFVDNFMSKFDSKNMLAQNELHCNYNKFFATTTTTTRLLHSAMLQYDVTYFANRYIENNHVTST